MNNWGNPYDGYLASVGDIVRIASVVPVFGGKVGRVAADGTYGYTVKFKEGVTVTVDADDLMLVKARPGLVIFDLDGTIVTTRSGDKFRRTADDWKFIGNRQVQISDIRKTGTLVAIATNQGGCAFPWSQISEEEMNREIKKVADAIDADRVAVCYNINHPKALEKYRREDNRRKPGPGMLLELMVSLNFNQAFTVMVGDRDEDEQAADAAGVEFISADEFFL